MGTCILYVEMHACVHLYMFVYVEEDVPTQENSDMSRNLGKYMLYVKMHTRVNI